MNLVLVSRSPVPLYFLLAKCLYVFLGIRLSQQAQLYSPFSSASFQMLKFEYFRFVSSLGCLKIKLTQPLPKSFLCGGRIEKQTHTRLLKKTLRHLDGLSLILEVNK